MQAHKAALESIPKVCRTASTLYELMVYYRLLGGLQAGGPQDKMTGFGSSMRKAVGGWFLDKSPMELAMQASCFKPLLPLPAMSPAGLAAA